MTLKSGDKVIVHYLLQPSIEATVVTPDEGDGWVECEGTMEIKGEEKGYEFLARVEMVQKVGFVRSGVKSGAAALRALRGKGGLSILAILLVSLALASCGGGEDQATASTGEGKVSCVNSYECQGRIVELLEEIRDNTHYLSEIEGGP